MMAELTKTNVVVPTTDELKKIKLSKPYNFEGKEFTELELDLENLTGEDLEDAELQMMVLNPQAAASVPMKEINKAFLALVAAKALKQPVEFVKRLPAKDYAKLTTSVSVFLMY